MYGNETTICMRLRLLYENGTCMGMRLLYGNETK